MFRIKNVRNATVAKQQNLSPSINRDIKPKPEIKQETFKRQPQSRLNARNKNEIPVLKSGKPGDQKLIRPPGQHNHKILLSKAHVEDLGHGKKIELGSSGLHRKILGHSTLLKEKKEEIIHNDDQIKIEIKKQEKKENPEKKDETSIEQPGEEDKKFLDFVSDQQKAKKQEIEQKEKEERQRKLRSQADIEQQRNKKEVENQRRIEKEEEKKREKEKEMEREKEHKEMMEKVMARRKARQEERQRKRKLQQIKKPERQEGEYGVSGFVSVSDPLAHIEMSEAIMDRQIQHLLRMKFAGFPNKQAIQRQVEELDRINQSYLMVREDPSNSLGRGLANFRIELFNRVGELIMAGQSQGGNFNSGLQMVEAESLNHRLIKGVKVSRGLQGHIQKLLKTKKLEHEQSCAICLGDMTVGEQIYEVRCGHEFHKACLQDWLNSTANCPSCRYNIKFDHA